VSGDQTDSQGRARVTPPSRAPAGGLGLGGGQRETTDSQGRARVAPPFESSPGGRAPKALLGDSAPALDWLTNAVPGGFLNHTFFVQHDPWLRRLSGEPEFCAAIEELERRHAQLSV